MAVYGASTLLAMQPCDPSSAFFGFMGVTFAIVFANMGAAYGTAKSGVGISSMGVMRPDMVMRSIIPVVMAGVLGIYGLITPYLCYMDAQHHCQECGSQCARGGSEFRWTCGECQLNLTADSRLQLSSRRTKHLQNRHGGGQRDPNSRLNGSNFVFKVSEAIPEEQREWNCPLCKGGLPHMSRFDKLIAVQAHIKAEHPKQTPWKLYNLRRKRDPVLRKVQEENGAKIRKTFDARRACGKDVYGKLGHKTVAVEPNWMEWTGSLKGRRKRCGAFISCARCFKGQASLTGVKCSGKAKFVKPQAQKFWKLLGERGYMNPGLIATAWKTTTAVLDKYYGYADPASVAFTGPHLGSHNAYGSEGPRRRLSKGSVSLLTWCLNVSAATVAWQVLEDAAVENVDAIALQEVKLDAEELKAFGGRADSLGYACFATRAKSRTKDDKEQGGAVFLVSKLYKSRIATKIVNNGGQATLVWVNGTLFGSCYAAHDSERLDFLQDLNTYVYAMDSQTMFHLMGDWNDEPDESPLAAALESAGGRVQATGAPTRWEGRRCIDYVITNAEKELANLREECAAYSDHKLLSWESPIRGEPRERWRLKKTTSYAPPSGCDVRRWQQNVASAWPEVQQDVKSATNREQLGENFRQLCGQLEAAFKIAFANCSEDGKRIPEASAKADPLDECFETRVWRNNLGRLKELARLEADEDQTAAKSNARQVLADKLARAKKVARIETLLESLRKDKLSTKISKWLDVRQGPPIHNIFDEEGESATQDIGEVLRVLVTHWRKVWHRSGPDLGNLHQLLEKVLGPKRKQQKWAHVSATELAKEAKKQAGAAASVDGWSGDEVVSFSIEMWEAIAAMSRDCERLGLAPEDLANAREAHIPKEGKDVRETDGALHAAAMRPITVLSALWRVWGRARLRNSDTAEWLESWLQPEICGGRRNVDALSSVIQLLEAACDNKFIATFDYSLAFDFTSPKLAAEIFEWLGMPIGDPWSLIAMAVVLLLPLLDLRRGPETTDIMLYVDDRALASTNASDCMNFGRKWKDWSSRLGLKENEAKEKYYHQNYALALEEFAKVGAPPKTISGAPALLGVELAPETGRPFTDKEKKKLDQAALVARKVEDAIARAGPNPAMGDRDLKKLFRGHSASPYFMAGQQVLMAAWRRAKRSKAVPGIWRDVGWVHTLCIFLQKIGCLEVAAWRWTTRLGGIIDLDPSSEDFDQTSGAVGHNTREAWRQTLFERWLARTDARTDSRQCQASAYNEQRCTLTRKLVANDTHRFAVVTGASVSPQKFEVMLSGKNRRNGREPNTILCPWCKEVRGADWEHMVWKCEASGKPPELAAPTDLLQRRLGWASTARTRAYNFAVLDWMAEVRQRILEAASQSSGRVRRLVEKKKLDQAALVARKARSLPLPASRRLRIAAAKAVPKAAYGWLCEAPTEQMFAKVEDAIARAGPNPAMGDRDLKKLFRGHSASPYFMAGQQVLMAAWRRAKRSKSLPGIWRDVGWVHTLCTFLQKIGCLEVAAWRWTTRLGGIIDLDPSSEDFDQTSGAVGHNTREAWRQTLFERWLARTDARTDSRQCQASAYNEQRCTLTRKLVANDTHTFAVVTGASVSPQKFEVMLSRKNRRNGREPNTILCPWCKEVRGADWEHMVWKCEASGKPPELAAPTDLLQRRLGWASTARTRAYNFAVLDWMAEVRQRILEESFPLTLAFDPGPDFVVTVIIYLTLYGLITAVIINGKMDAATYSAHSGYARLGAGLTVGMSSLAAGLAIGVVGDAGVRANAQQPRLFVGMILILIFAEALGLYGLIVGLVVASTAEGKGKGLCSPYNV
ncbi:unnamed protein product [Polarella glacialis]|uniref:V-type proton ATPase proteolipid subunit n=1 Tax=Polarella glacialis TaxID=89957 RepID=A0A813JVK8_POLGL|nr:unnamed protein product [Polarella glacialis]